MIESKAMLITLGFAHCKDYDGAYFTLENWQIQAATELLPAGYDVEYVIVENCPGNPQADALANLVQNFTRGRGRVVHESLHGTSQARNRIFKEARGEVTVVSDCHVLTLPGTIKNIVDYIVSQGPDCGDLVSGPLMYDDLAGVSTHFNPTWGGEMYGQWGTDEENLRKGEPFEIPGMGLGLFACRTNKWLGFNKWFRGFGGEEMYIHEKVRRAGFKNVCVPDAPWIHRFARPLGQPYISSRWEKVRNYILGRLELSQTLDDVHREFVVSGLLTRAAWEHLLKDPITHEQPPATMEWIPGRKPDSSCGGCSAPTQTLPQPPVGLPIDGVFHWACNEKRDLDEHLPKLYELAKKCDSATAITKRREAAIPLLAARCSKFVRVFSYETDALFEHLRTLQLEEKLTEVLTISSPIDSNIQSIERTDLLFIDSVHTFEQLIKELSVYGPLVNKYIVLHDVAIYDFKGEDDKSPGLLAAVIAFVRSNPEWTVVYHTRSQYGLMVLSRVDDDKKALPGIGSKIFNFIKHASAHLREGMPAASDEVFERRLDLCAICPSRNHEHCGLCGCPLAAKAAWADSTCDINTWKKAGL